MLLHYMTCVAWWPVQVQSENLINAPGLTINFTDGESLMLTQASKAALSMAPYKPAADVPFATWSTPVTTPAGQLANAVPLDRNGVARSLANDLPGVLCCVVL